MSDPMNKMRARWAAAALEQHSKRIHDQKESKQEQVAALLCNLQHWADANGVDFGIALEEAGEAYESETNMMAATIEITKTNEDSKELDRAERQDRSREARGVRKAGDGRKRKDAKAHSRVGR